jgi:hypothetical protein
LANKANERRRHKSAKCAMTLATKALAKDEHNKDNDNVARRIEAYAAPFFARVDAVMAKIRAIDDGFGNWAAFGDELLVKEDDEASAPTMPPSAPPTAMSSPHHRPVQEGDSARCIPQSYQLPLVASPLIQHVVLSLPRPHLIRNVSLLPHRHLLPAIVGRHVFSRGS